MANAALQSWHAGWSIHSGLACCLRVWLWAAGGLADEGMAAMLSMMEGQLGRLSETIRAKDAEVRVRVRELVRVRVCEVQRCACVTQRCACACVSW